MRVEAAKTRNDKDILALTLRWAEFAPPIAPKNGRRTGKKGADMERPRFVELQAWPKTDFLCLFRTALELIWPVVAPSPRGRR